MGDEGQEVALDPLVGHQGVRVDAQHGAVAVFQSSAVAVGDVADEGVVLVRRLPPDLDRRTHDGGDVPDDAWPRDAVRRFPDDEAVVASIRVEAGHVVIRRRAALDGAVDEVVVVRGDLQLTVKAA